MTIVLDSFLVSLFVIAIYFYGFTIAIDVITRVLYYVDSKRQKTNSNPDDRTTKIW